MARKTETPFNKIMQVRSKLAMLVKYGDHALGEQTFQEFAVDVHECFEYLMEFRNIINGMVALEEPPSRAVVPYLSDDVRADLAEA